MAWLTGWAYRKSITLSRASGAVTNYQMKLLVNKYLNYLPYKNNPNANSPECNVFGIISGELFWGNGYDGSNIGYIQKTNLSTGTTTNLKTGTVSGSPALLGCWAAGPVIGSDVYVGGQLYAGTPGVYGVNWHSKVTLWKVNTSGVTQVQHDDTDDCNELFSMDSDGTYLIAGERAVGGQNNYSNWPNGSGLWQIPIATYDTPATWSRIYEDASRYQWISLVYRSGTWYAMLQDAGYNNAVANGKWKVQHSSNLTDWTVDLDYTAQTAGYDMWQMLMKAGTNLVAFGNKVADHHFHMFVFNGSSWTDYDLGIAYSASSSISGYWDSDRSKVVFIVGTVATNGTATSDVYEVNIDNTGLIAAHSNVPGWNPPVSPRLYEVAVESSKVYFPMIYTTSTGSAVYKIGLFMEDSVIALGGSCEDDFKDIRVTKSDGITVLDSYRENYTSGEVATIWVEFDSIQTTDTTFYLYFGNSGASDPSNGANTFITFDDLERGINGDAIGGSWTVVQGTPKISTAQAYKGTRSGLFGGATTYPYAYISPAADNNKAVRMRTYGFYTNAPYVQFGNAGGTYKVGFYVTSGGIVKNTKDNSTIGTITGSTSWHLWDIVNLNFTTCTYDLYVDGTLLASGVAMHASGFGALGLSNTSTTGGQNIYIDNVMIRNYSSPEPAWGSWGSEEEEFPPSGTSFVAWIN